MPKHPRTNAHSTGEPCQSGSSNIDGRVHVPVMVRPAIRAVPFSDGQGKHMPCGAARAASLRGRKEAVYLDQMHSVPRRLVSQHADQFIPTAGEGFQ